MSNSLSAWNDTIVAPATPPGVGALGIIRLSGNNAFKIINELFPSKNIISQASHTLHVGLLKEEDNILDEVVVSLFKSPKSYTGEDVVEISCHGSNFVQAQILNACIKKSARLAKPGEFTQRAFLNGKLDLTQAEAVADLIASNTAASQKTALNNMRGGFSDQLKNIREQLISFSALIELELDFSQEDVEFADRNALYKLINESISLTQRLIESFQLGNVIKNGLSVAIIGKPNAGKSTLLNALLNDERAIVSPIAGTTRDSIEETININGVLFRFIDTAGIREHTNDIIEGLGIERSFQNAAKADLVLHVIDISQDESDLHTQNWLLKNGKKLITVYNKADLWNKKTDKTTLSPGSFLAAKTGEGIDKLKAQIFDFSINANIETDTTIITNTRHHSVLQQLLQSLTDIKNAMNNDIPGDLISLDIKRSLHFIGELTGEITNEDTLDYVFSKFCIGK